MSGDQEYDVSTPEKQLELLCLVLGNPKLPRQQLNRLLQCRMAFRADRGLPPTYRRALQQLAVHLPPKAEPKKTRAKKLVPKSVKPEGESDA